MGFRTKDFKIRSARKRRGFVLCPLCDKYIARDSMAWIVHMETDHSATPGTWTDTGIRGGGHGQRDVRDSEPHELPFRWGSICYGCSASFQTEAELLSHLLTMHEAS